MGLHNNTLPPSTSTSAVRWFWSFLWLYYAALCFTKLSIFLQYLKVLPHRTLSRVCYAMVGLVSAWTCWVVFSGIFTCTPISLFWTNRDPNAKGCIPRLPLWYDQTVSH